jgi:hypothetical protein
MRNYWIKVGLGAVVIFVIGLIAVRAVRSGASGVRNVVNGTGPISIPLPSMVPFNLDGVRLGSVRHLTIFRSDSKTPSHIKVEIQIPDSITSERLTKCILTIESLDNIDEHTSFLCATAADTAGKELVPFGTVAVRSRSDSFPLLLPQRAVNDMTKRHQAGDSADTSDKSGHFGDSAAAHPAASVTVSH